MWSALWRLVHILTSLLLIFASMLLLIAGLASVLRDLLRRDLFESSPSNAVGPLPPARR